MIHTHRGYTKCSPLSGGLTVGNDVLAFGLVGAAAFAAVLVLCGLGAAWFARRVGGAASGWSRRAAAGAASFGVRAADALASRPGILRAA